MTPLIPALAGALMVAGLIGVAVGLRPSPAPSPRPTRRARVRRWQVSRRTQVLLLAGLLVGGVVALFTGWLVAVLVVPAAAAGLPVLLATPPRTHLDRLEAMEEWTRSLAGVLTVGVGLEEALVATLRSDTGADPARGRPARRATAGPLVHRSRPPRDSPTSWMMRPVI